MTFALLCPGQGHQHPGMFDLFEHHAGAQSVLEDAASVLGDDIRAWLRGPDDIFSNVRAQPLICIAQLAAWRALREDLPQPALVAGYSVGELASYACADALDARDLCRLACIRARAMEDAAGLHPGTLVAIEGLRRSDIEGLCAGRDAWPAIIIDEARCIIGGSRRDVDDLALAARARGAQVQGLRVGVASHTPLLAGAVGTFRSALEASRFGTPVLPVIAGVNALLVTGRDDAINLLCRQMTETVDWSRCLQALYERGCRVFLELGPGAALARMVRERFADVEVRSVDDFRSVSGVVEWMNARVASAPQRGRSA